MQHPEEITKVILSLMKEYLAIDSSGKGFAVLLPEEAAPDLVRVYSRAEVAQIVAENPKTLPWK